ncbi:MAG TPA: hypothetical protein VK178_10945 [Opitutaceae bacterium]|nr:hypothetical protein [Opitutaceae bacterium]
MRRIDYLKAFLKSGDHAALALLTLGVPFATGQPLALVIGAALYVVGWVYLPDRKGFRAKIDARATAAGEQQDAAALAALQAERARLFAQLNDSTRRRYEDLARVCADIEEQLATAPAGTVAPTDKLDGLMWSYLGLLATERRLDQHLVKEDSENFAERIAEAETELKTLEGELTRTPPDSPAYETKFRLVSAKKEGLEALRRRHEQFNRSMDNLAVVRAEQNRIEEQLKLLRADFFANQSADALASRISDTIDSLATGSRVASELTSSMPELPTLRTRRVGYQAPQKA